MAIYGALAENQRRNERVDRGIITIPAGGVANIVLGPMANASATLVLANPPGELGGMRFMTHFELAIDDIAGSKLLNSGLVQVSGGINTANKTIGSITYPPSTVLTINAYTYTNTTSLGGWVLTLGGVGQPIRFTIWGTLMNQGSATIDGGTF